MGRRAYVGLVASSHQKTVTNTVKIDRVTVSPGADARKQNETTDENEINHRLRENAR